MDMDFWRIPAIIAGLFLFAVVTAFLVAVFWEILRAIYFPLRDHFRGNR